MGGFSLTHLPSCIAGEVEKIVQRHKAAQRSGGDRDSSSGLVFVLLMNEAQFLLIAAYLKLENVNDIVLVHSSPINRESSLFHLVKQHLDWRKVGVLHTFNAAIQDKILKDSFVLDSKPAAAAEEASSIAPGPASSLPLYYTYIHPSQQQQQRRLPYPTLTYPLAVHTGRPGLRQPLPRGHEPAIAAAAAR